MRLRISVVIGLGSIGVLGCGGGGGHQKLSPEQVIAKSRVSTFEIRGKGPSGEFGGTGVVIDASGLALTNAHVVGGLAALKARLLDKTEVPVKIVAQNPCEDIALVKLGSVPPGVKPIPIGSSAALKAGEHVTALGYPQSLTDPGKGTVVSTAGPVNVVDTSSTVDPTSNKYASLIQHQAQINHGNSGGPLVNDYGELVGINTLGTDPSFAQGQNYAIAINRVKTLLPNLKAGKNTDYVGWTLAPLDAEIVNRYFQSSGLADEVIKYLDDNKLGDSLFVTGVDAGSPADKKNIEEGDLIVRINGTPVHTIGDVCDIAASAQSGVDLKVEGKYLADADTVAEIGKAWAMGVNLR